MANTLVLAQLAGQGPISSPIGIALTLLVVIPLAIVLLVYLIVPMGKGIAWVVGRVVRFVGSMIRDTLRVVGSLLTSIAFIPLTLANVLIGRWSAAAHYGRALETEVRSIGACLYRLALGHPLKLVGLGAMMEGFEQRLPQVVAAAPGAERPSKQSGQFDGYTIIGSLAGGGSGSRLFVAQPSVERLAAFARAGQGEVDKVVIKSFSLMDGSSLPQIVRENRALTAAKRLGLILEHELNDERFYYVMRYMPGDSLAVMTPRLHAMSGGGGLAGRSLVEATEYAADLLRTLHHYHSGGLWHKDVKPDNIIIANGQAHLVDFGLITPLRSSMTLTTHGTEYFRDPEMVRMALRGVKVHEVDGAKFDIYGAGAVLYSMIENSFPAHGGLSQISKRCPEALRWIVRRAMTDYDKRYDSAATMLADLEAVLSASDPFVLRPGDLPSVRGGLDGPMAGELAPPPLAGAIAGNPRLPLDDESPIPGAARVGRQVSPAAFAGASVAAAAAGVHAPVWSRTPQRPVLRVANWWTGRYDTDAVSPSAAVAVLPARSPRVAGGTAAEQLSRARARAQSARARAQGRMKSYRKDFPGGVNTGVVVAFIVFVGLIGMVVTALVTPRLFSHLWNTAFDGGAVNVVTNDDQEGDRSFAVVVDPQTIEAFPAVAGVLQESDAGSAPMPPHVRVLGSTGERHIVIDRRRNRTTTTTTTVGSSDQTHAVPATPPVPSVPQGVVIVLRDPVTFETNASERVRTQLDKLAQAGFSMRGDHTVEHAAGEEASAANGRDLETADLRNELGVKPFKSSVAADTIRAWLAQRPELTALVWMGRSDVGESEAWVVARAGANSQTVSGLVRALRSPSSGQ